NGLVWFEASDAYSSLGATTLGHKRGHKKAAPPGGWSGQERNREVSCLMTTSLMTASLTTARLLRRPRSASMQACAAARSAKGCGERFCSGDPQSNACSHLC